jgi:hypothetical protein
MVSKEQAESYALNAVIDYLKACGAETEDEKTLAMAKMVSVSAFAVSQFSDDKVARLVLAMTSRLYQQKEANRAH